MRRPAPHHVAPRLPAPRRGVLAAAAAGAVLLGGCSVTSPFTTQEPRSFGDGVMLNLGDLDVSSLVIVSDEKGGPGTLSGYVVNDGPEPVTVGFGIAEPAAAVEVGAGATVSLADPATRITLAAVPQPPGSMTQLVVTTAKTGKNTVLVPVLTSQRYYSDLSPSAAPSPTTSPTSSPTTSPTSSPTPSPS